jgi:hypothetical protein
MCTGEKMSVWIQKKSKLKMGAKMVFLASSSSSVFCIETIVANRIPRARLGEENRKFTDGLPAITTWLVFRCDDGRFLLSAQHCQYPTPTTFKVKIEYTFLNSEFLKQLITNISMRHLPSRLCHILLEKWILDFPLSAKNKKIKLKYTIKEGEFGEVVIGTWQSSHGSTFPSLRVDTRL